MEIQFKNVTTLLGLCSTADAKRFGGTVTKCGFRTFAGLPHFEIPSPSNPGLGILIDPEYVSTLWLDPSECPSPGSLLPTDFVQVVQLIECVYLNGSGWIKHPAAVTMSGWSFLQPNGTVSPPAPILPAFRPLVPLVPTMTGFQVGDGVRAMQGTRAELVALRSASGLVTGTIISIGNAGFVEVRWDGDTATHRVDVMELELLTTSCGTSCPSSSNGTVIPPFNGTSNPIINGVPVSPGTISVGGSSSPTPNAMATTWAPPFTYAPLVTVDPPPLVMTVTDDGKPKCDCGAVKCKTTHYHWCSTMKERP